MTENKEEEGRVISIFLANEQPLPKCHKIHTPMNALKNGSPGGYSDGQTAHGYV